MTEESLVWEVFIQSKNGLAHKHVGNVRKLGQRNGITKCERFIHKKK